MLIEHIYVVTVTCQPSKCHKIQSKVNAMGTFHLSFWCGSNLQQTKRLLSRTDRRQTDGRLDVTMFRVPFRNSVKMDFACCSFHAVLWPNVDALHLPFLYRVSPFLSSTFLRCDNAGTETPIMYFFRQPLTIFLLGAKIFSGSQMSFIRVSFLFYNFSKRHISQKVK
jgi:hypothetical protein